MVWKSSLIFFTEFNAREMSSAMPVDRGTVTATRMRVFLSACRK